MVLCYGSQVKMLGDADTGLGPLGRELLLRETRMSRWRQVRSYFRDLGEHGHHSTASVERKVRGNHSTDLSKHLPSFKQERVAVVLR